MRPGELDAMLERLEASLDSQHPELARNVARTRVALADFVQELEGIPGFGQICTISISLSLVENWDEVKVL